MLKVYWRNLLIPFQEEVKWHIENTEGFTTTALKCVNCDAGSDCRNGDGREGALLYSCRFNEDIPMNVRRYCDGVCRQAAYRDRKRAVKAVPQLQKCELCETTFVDLKHGTTQRFCSVRCRSKARRLRYSGSKP